MWNLQRKLERQLHLRAVASGLGMEFHAKDEFGMRNLLKDFQLFQRGRRRTLSNILYKATGLLEEKTTIMDYSYTIQAGNNPVTYSQTVFFLQSKWLALPEMLLKPEHFFHKIGAWLGLQQDIDFEEHQEFSDKFLLQGEEEHRIRQTLKEQVRKFFLIEKDWCMECIGFYLIFYREKSLAAPGYIETLYKKGMTLYDYLKDEKPFPP